MSNNIIKENLLSCNCIILVVASRGNIYDNFIENYWKKFIKHIDKNNEHFSNKIKILMLFGNDEIEDLNIFAG